MELGEAGSEEEGEKDGEEGDIGEGAGEEVGELHGSSGPTRVNRPLLSLRTTLSFGSAGMGSMHSGALRIDSKSLQLESHARNRLQSQPGRLSLTWSNIQSP